MDKKESERDAVAEAVPQDQAVEGGNDLAWQRQWLKRRDNKLTESPEVVVCVPSEEEVSKSTIRGRGEAPQVQHEPEESAVAKKPRVLTRPEPGWTARTLERRAEFEARVQELAQQRQGELKSLTWPQTSGTKRRP